ncbi:SdpI family protein [Streptomyces sp. NBC_00237]|uniref:SdpI family protein n=1 Tax=Streptomyces sp. NBC_00237 TaxID=2975687 RepID=UPI0022503BDA|nr:SdpI family protein [Streptomyces sp. NBC_00237]MCX5204975.1 SdpI family protein [Streptomyces sp. NBC_00237]
MDPAAGLVFGVGLLTLGLLIQYMKKQVASGNIQRNSAIGIRTKATMASDAAWERGHAASAPMLTATFLTAYAAGAISVVLGVVMMVSDSANAAVIVVPLCGLVVVLGLLVAASVAANTAARAVGNSDR